MTNQMKKIGITLTVALGMVSSMSMAYMAEVNPLESTATSSNAWGATAVVEGKTYSLSEMLLYAIEDEYTAHDEYAAIIAKYGSVRPFSNIIQSESTHISYLNPLLSTYKVSFSPESVAAHVSVPSDLTSAYQAGVDAEIKNIAMYDQFLKADLPADVRTVFEFLKRASENHLRAFKNATSRAGLGISTPVGNGQGRVNGGGNGNGFGMKWR